MARFPNEAFEFRYSETLSSDSSLHPRRSNLGISGHRVAKVSCCSGVFSLSMTSCYGRVSCSCISSADCHSMAGWLSSTMLESGFLGITGSQKTQRSLLPVLLTTWWHSISSRRQQERVRTFLGCNNFPWLGEGKMSLVTTQR